MSFLSRVASHSAIGVLESRILPCASTLRTWSWNGFSSAAAPSTGGSAPTTRPPGAPASAPSGAPSTSASPADVADIVFKRIEVTPELKKWIYKEKPRLNAPFITVSALQNAMPRGLTLDELWEKVKGTHENFVCRATLRDLLLKLGETGYRKQKVVAVRADPSWHYLVVRQANNKSEQRGIVRMAKKQHAEAVGTAKASKSSA